MIVVKLGGSTLGSHDTSLDDIAALNREGRRIVIVHGGGGIISEWLDKHGIESRFLHGLRATDAEALDVVVAVLAGVVNKHLVAALEARGARAVGASGADGGILRARRFDPELGYVGEVAHVEPEALVQIVDGGAVAVLAPIAIEGDAETVTSQLLNVNADTAAGAIAAALHADELIFLTDVPGVLDADEAVRPSLGVGDVEALIAADEITGGMIPKLRAAVQAAEAGAEAVIADGRKEGMLRSLLVGEEATEATRIHR